MAMDQASRIEDLSNTAIAPTPMGAAMTPIRPLARVLFPPRKAAASQEVHSGSSASSRL